MEIRRNRVTSASVGISFSITSQVVGSVVEPVASAPSAPDALLEFRVYDPTGTIFLGTLTRRHIGSSFSEDLNGPGTGNLVIHSSDPALQKRRSILADRNIIRAVLEGQVVFAWRVQGGEATLVDRNEHAGLTISMAGPGVLEVLKDGILRPEWPIGGEPTKSAGERRFGYMSQDDIAHSQASGQPPWYDASAWSTTRFVSVAKKDIKVGPAIVFPERWPDNDAGVLWPTNPNDPAVPGVVYWRGEFTLASRTRIGVYASADDILELYLDGVKIIEDGDVSDPAFTRTSEWTGLMDAGPHLIAAKTQNRSDVHAAGNWAFFICSVMQTDSQGNPQTPLFRSGRTGWRTFWSGNATVPFTDVTKSTGAGSVAGAGGTYTVRSGDTMIKIGAKFGIDWRRIYEANKSLIDNDPRITRLPKRPAAWWIFPGMVLTLPGVSGAPTGPAAGQTTTTRVWRAGVPLTTPTPGWLPYQILAKAFWEAKSRGVSALSAVTLGFEGGVDSAGTIWQSGEETRHERAFPLGSTVYQVAQDLVESGMDIRMTPDLVLEAYVEMGTYRGHTSPRPFLLYDPANSTYTYQVRRSASIVNDLLVDTDDGWRDYREDSSIADQGRTEGNLSLGGVEPDKLLQAVGSELEELARPKKTIETSWRYQEGRRPYIDFDLGDTVVAVNELGIEFDARITSIGIAEEAENVLRVSVEASGEDFS